VVTAVVALIVVTVVLVLVAVWHLSSLVGDVLTVEEDPWRDEVHVVRADSSTVTLQPLEDGPDWLTAGRVYGLDWGEGFGHVTDVRAQSGGTVTRTLRVLEGEPPPAGSNARFTREGFPREPDRFLDGPVREVVVDGKTGRMPAWFAPGRGRTWAVLVHGGGGTRSEMFRLMRSTVAQDMPSLDITYRGDPDNGGGTTQLGETEWRDVEAAVQHALDRGARDVVLLGASMGCTLTAAFLERSDLADRVSAVVFDSPLLDFTANADYAAERTGWPIPGLVKRSVLRLSSWRYDVDLGSVDYLDDTSWLGVPVLSIHGTTDGMVPVSMTERLEVASPELVEARYVEGAGHVESWNQDPQRYDRWVRSFLASHSGP
jgi:pimeloyl-ACP methyl ester carboxylesterase